MGFEWAKAHTRADPVLCPHSCLRLMWSDAEHFFLSFILLTSVYFFACDLGLYCYLMQKIGKQSYMFTICFNSLVLVQAVWLGIGCYLSPLCT